MKRGVFGLSLAVSVLAFAGTVHAVTLDTSGYGAKPTPTKPTPTPEPIVVDTKCLEWVLIKADVDYNSTDGMDKYTFLGNCNINVDTTGYNPKIENLPFKLEAEWFDKMKRASEKVTVISAQYGVTFSTWATCNRDPFPDKTASCHSQGMGAHKWSLYINQKQAPFGKGRTTKAAALAKSGNQATPTPTKPPTATPTKTGTGTAQPTVNPNEKAPTIVSPTQNQAFPAGGNMLIKIQPASGSNVTKFDVELQKKVSGVWQAWTNLTYDSQANPNGVNQQTGTQNPERRLRARAQAVPNAQWTAWVLFQLQ